VVINKEHMREPPLLNRFLLVLIYWLDLMEWQV